MKLWIPQAIIFDMDGLLVDSEPVWRHAETELLKAHGRAYNWDIHQHYIGLRMKEFLSRMIADYQLPDSYDALRPELIQRMSRLVPAEAIVRPGVHELLVYIKEHNIPRAIASSSALAIIDAVVESKGWSDIFTVRCSGDDVEHGKPFPDVYLKAASLVGADPTRCLALEDSPTGARAAVAAGMTCYAVPDLSHSAMSAFDDITPHVYESLHDVLASLKAEV